MAVNLSQLQAAVDAAVAEADATKTVEDGAATLIKNFAAATAKAVTDALAADDAADQGSIDAVTAAMTAVTKSFTEARVPLGDAIANVPA